MTFVKWLIVVGLLLQLLRAAKTVEGCYRQEWRDKARLDDIPRPDLRSWSIGTPSDRRGLPMGVASARA